MQFDELGLNETLAQATAQLGWDRPTHLQQRVIPHILSGRNLRIIVPSGGGKTAAYLLPILQRLLENGQSRGALVVAVPQEHADRVRTQATRFVSEIGLPESAVSDAGHVSGDTRLVVAGPSEVPEASEGLPEMFRKPAFLVLDAGEAFEEGMEPGQLEILEGFLSSLPDDCQRLCFCDGPGSGNSLLSGNWLRDPVALPVPEGGNVIYPVANSKKGMLLSRLFKEGTLTSCLLVTRNREGADRIQRYLSRKGIRCARVRGPARRERRERWSHDLADGRLRGLVASFRDLKLLRDLSFSQLVWVDPPGAEIPGSRGFHGAYYGAEGVSRYLRTPKDEALFQGLFAGVEAAPEEMAFEDLQKDDPPKPSPRQSRARPDKRGEKGRNASKTGRRKKERSGQPGAETKKDPGQKSAPSDDQESLFPGSRKRRWNSFNLSLEGDREESQPHPPQQRKRKRTGKPVRKRGGADEKALARENRPDGKESDQPARPADDERTKEAVARRFNSSARYSSLAGAPPSPKK